MCKLREREKDIQFFEILGVIRLYASALTTTQFESIYSQHLSVKIRILIPTILHYKIHELVFIGFVFTSSASIKFYYHNILQTQILFILCLDLYLSSVKIRMHQSSYLNYNLQGSCIDFVNNIGNGMKMNIKFTMQILLNLLVFQQTGN